LLPLRSCTTRSSSHTSHTSFVSPPLEAARAEAVEANRWLRELQTISKAALEGTTLDEARTAVLRAMSAMFGAVLLRRALGISRGLPGWAL